MTKAQARRACKWFQENIGLAGWTIKVCLKDCPAEIDATPDDEANNCGMYSVHRICENLFIWINPKIAVDKPGDYCDSLSTLMHELMHGAFFAVGINSSPLQEHLIDRIANMLAAQYRQWQIKS